MNKGEGVEKLEVSSEHTFGMIQSLFAKIYDMLIFNHIPLSTYNLDSDTNYSQWPFLRIILNFYQGTHISHPKWELSTTSWEKCELSTKSWEKKNNDEHERQY